MEKARQETMKKFKQENGNKIHAKIKAPIVTKNKK